ncbi:MAG TPA: hypothetical protein VER58_09770 [Thermoanaerobaculia bacterium]|nr:hypothetical protein [Thermoanaerobaculia bacterium]
MRRLISSLVMVQLALAIPATALTKAEKEAKHQCRVTYNAEKKEAGKLGTHRARVDAKRDAKKKYNACVENATRKP